MLQKDLAIFGPYVIIVSLVFVVLGVWIFKQRSLAAVCLLILNVGSDALSYLFPALNVDGVASFSAYDLAVDVAIVVLTGIMLITGRTARRAES